jgi:hypothetical protein
MVNKMGRKLTDEEKTQRKETRERNKKIKEEKERIERRKNDIERHLYSANQWIGRFGEPTYKFNVGDRVQHGAVKKSIIKEVYGDGKVYVLDEVCTDNNYGNAYDYEREIVVHWTDIKPYRTPEEINDIPIFTITDDIRIRHMNTSLMTLVGQMYRWGIDLEPDYQRDLVWDEEDKISLIHSMFHNIDIGKFTTIKRPFNEDGTIPSYEILDGKQRLSAVIEFFQGRFKYNGKIYQELHPKDQHHLKDYHILLAEVQERITQKQKYQYFLKLNTTGKPQSKEHMDKVRELYEQTEG